MIGRFATAVTVPAVAMLFVSGRRKRCVRNHREGATAAYRGVAAYQDAPSGCNRRWFP